MRGGDVTVGYEIATDPALRDIVRRGEATAEQAFAYSVHLDVARPAARPTLLVSLHQRRCRQAASDERRRCRRRMPHPSACVSLSPPARITSTAISPPTGISPTKIRNSCCFSATISTKPSRRSGRRCAATRDGIEAATLPTYRNRYAQYRLDPDLQRLHAEVPACVTWDDHEVANDYGDKWSERFDDPQMFLMRRAAAYQAFYEHMPVRPILSLPNGPIMRLYDRFKVGDLIEMSDDRRAAIPLAAGLLHAAIQGRHASGKRRQLSGAARGRPHHDGLCARRPGSLPGWRTAKRSGI